MRGGSGRLGWLAVVGIVHPDASARDHGEPGATSVDEQASRASLLEHRHSYGSAATVETVGAAKIVCGILACRGPGRESPWR